MKLTYRQAHETTPKTFHSSKIHAFNVRASQDRDKTKTTNVSRKRLQLNVLLMQQQQQQQQQYARSSKPTLNIGFFYYRPPYLQDGRPASETKISYQR